MSAKDAHEDEPEGRMSRRPSASPSVADSMQSDQEAGTSVRRASESDPSMPLPASPISFTRRQAGQQESDGQALSPSSADKDVTTPTPLTVVPTSPLATALLAANDDAASVSNISLRSQRSTSSTSTTTRTLADDILKRTASPASNISDRATTQLSDVTASSVMQFSSSSRSNASGSVRPHAQERDKSAVLASQIRRNYIYFTSLLQEPEAKWKHFSDSRGVTITQLDSIDPTLVVYRAEATFVGVGIRDLYAAIVSPGVKNNWDRGVEQGILLQDLGDSSKLWWNKIRATWPVAARDSVLIETAYKSPTAIHVFSFSTNDKQLFPSIPSPDPNAIRTQIDLRGWSIEMLSPTTAHVTLIEQSDPKGWTSKASATPAAMTAAVAGVGDFAIKQGAPPMLTKLRGARMKTIRYENDKSLTRLEYELSVPVNQKVADTPSGNVECEIRCDVDTWSPSLDVIVDPPPLNVRCVRRHKLSPAGGGLYITIEQATASLEDDPSRITVRKANNKEKGVVYVNGARMKTEVEELKDEEAAQLRDQKRTKPRRTPLDLVTDSPRKPMIGSISSPSSTTVSRTGTPANVSAVTAASSNLAGITNAAASTNNGEGASATSYSIAFSDERFRKPMKCALDVLYLLRRIHAERSPDPAGNPAGWSLVSQRNGMYVRRKLMQSISSTVTIQRSDKVVEGLTAENILAVASDIHCRKVWDDKVDSARMLESYGNGATTGFFTTKASFPFRGRAFHLASLTARSGPSATPMGIASSSSMPTVYFHASSSYSEKNSTFSDAKLNPSSLPVGGVLIDGWILETLDPYSSTLNYQIPSTRVTHLIAVDYAGSLPVTVNAMWNTQLTRSIGLVEEYLKSKGSLPAIRCPPFSVEVLGDGRDDDHDLTWSLTDDRPKRGTTLIANDFDPASRACEILCLLNKDDKGVLHSQESSGEDGDGVAKATSAPLAMPFPRRAHAISNASTTRGLASAPIMSSSPSSHSLYSADGTEDGLAASISRTTSMSSLRSTGSKSRASILRSKDAAKRKASDFVVVDAEVDLRHYEGGYEVDVIGEFGPIKQRDDEAVPPKTGTNGTDVVADESSVKSGETEKALVSFPSDKAKTEESSTNSVWSLQAASEQESKGTSTTATTPTPTPSLPFAVSIYDMPPSAVLAATLDPSARPKKHLVRVTLPTSAFLDTARLNPFYGPDPDDAPAWYDAVRERGAVVRVRVSSHVRDDNDTAGADASGSSSPSMHGTSTGSSRSSQSGDGELDSQHIAVFFKGERLTVTHVNKTSAMLQRESEDEQVHAILKRIAKPTASLNGALTTNASQTGSLRKKTLRALLLQDGSEDGVPNLLLKPIAVALSLQAAKEEAAKTTGAEALKVNEQTNGATITPSTSGDVGDVTTPMAGKINGSGGGSTPRAGNASQQTPSARNTANASTSSGGSSPSPASAASAQIMSILNAYPLSRLGGASTAVSTTVANGGVFSRKAVEPSDAAGADANGKGSGNGGADAKGDKGTGAATDDEGTTLVGGVPGQLIDATEQFRKRLTDVKCNLSTVVLVALIAFLLGSLVRSLLEPADFVLVKKLTGEATNAQHGHIDPADDGLQAVAVRELKQMLAGGDDAPGHAGSSVAWRELRRLVEIRNLFGGRWDLVIAAARR